MNGLLKQGIDERLIDRLGIAVLLFWFVSVPLTLLVKNYGEINVKISELLYFNLIVISVIYFFRNKLRFFLKKYKVFFIIFISIFIFSYFQYTFLNPNMGLLDGKNINFREYQGLFFCSNVLWISFVFLNLVKFNKFIKIYLLFLNFIILFSVLNVFFLINKIIDLDDGKKIVFHMKKFMFIAIREIIYLWFSIIFKVIYLIN